MPVLATMLAPDCSMAHALKYCLARGLLLGLAAAGQAGGKCTSMLAWPDHTADVPL